ncbi:cellulose binding domain-containing protein [Caldicellulosiruptor bescii]|nr:cellulose binding domain-containing protein [Caldicellulosiruptor bescii]
MDAEHDELWRECEGNSVYRWCIGMGTGAEWSDTNTDSNQHQHQPRPQHQLLHQRQHRLQHQHQLLPPTPTPSSTPVAGGQIKVLYANKETNSTTNTIRPWLKVVNTGSSSIDLSRVTIRYWYTVDGDKAQSAISDWAQIGASNVTFKFVKLSSSVSGADYYLEIGFKSGAGQLQAGKDTGEIQIRFNRVTGAITIRGMMVMDAEHDELWRECEGNSVYRWCIGMGTGADGATPTPTATPAPTVTPTANQHQHQPRPQQ